MSVLNKQNKHLFFSYHTDYLVSYHTVPSITLESPLQTRAAIQHNIGQKSNSPLFLFTFQKWRHDTEKSDGQIGRIVEK